MHVYKELNIVGDKNSLDEFSSEIDSFFPADWTKPQNNQLKDYIVADYVGNKAPHAEVSIYYGMETWRGGYVKVGNIVPLEKDQLTICEYNTVLDMFYDDIVKPYVEKHPTLKIDGPTSGLFNPLDYITTEALDKLTAFCHMANKTTGSSHPYDEQRWFDFICQTVDDDRAFDYDTLYRFLTDEEYWGKSEDSSGGAVGRFAWSEEKAAELALEYDNYVRILQYYKESMKEI